MHDVQEIFDKMAKSKVLIVGDVMLDRYLRGKVDRISPEAPVPIIQLHSSENRLGGAANVALNIRAMGATPILCSVIGNQENSQLFVDLFPEGDIAPHYLYNSPARPTTVKTRVIADNQHMLRVDSESTADLNPEEESGLFEIIQEAMNQLDIDLILFQDYNKGVLTKTLIQKISAEANNRNIPIAVDPKFSNFFEYRGATLFKPNLKEIREALGQVISPDKEALDQAVSLLTHQLAQKYTLITLSEKGIYWNDGTRSEVMPTLPRDISDVCGAGDTVISVASLALAAGLPLREISILSNLAGGQVCESVGVVPINAAQLKEEYLQLITKSDSLR